MMPFGVILCHAKDSYVQQLKNFLAVLSFKIHFIFLTCEGKGLTEHALTLDNTLSVACNDAKRSVKED